MSTCYCDGPAHTYSPGWCRAGLGSDGRPIDKRIAAAQLELRAMTWGCSEVVTDDEGRVWECLAPPNHAGGCFLSQTSGPEYDPGDFGGMST